MMHSRSGKSGRFNSIIDLTSLLDVIFIFLFVMVISNLLAAQKTQDAAAKEVEAAKEEIAVLQKDNEELVTKAEEISAQAENLLAKNKSLEAQIAEKEALVAKYEKDIAELNTKAASLETSNAALTEEVKAANKKITELEANIVGLYEEIAELAEEKDGLLKDIAALQEEIVSLNTKVAKLEKENEDLENAKSNLENAVDYLNNAITSLSSSTVTGDEKTKALAEQVSELTAKLINYETSESTTNEGLDSSFSIQKTTGAYVRKVSVYMIFAGYGNDNTIDVTKQRTLSIYMDDEEPIVHTFTEATKQTAYTILENTLKNYIKDHFPKEDSEETEPIFIISFQKYNDFKDDEEAIKRIVKGIQSDEEFKNVYYSIREIEKIESK